MMTRADAYQFLTSFFKLFDITLNNNITTIKNYFSDQLTGHYKERQFSYSDFTTQLKVIMPSIHKLHFVIEDLAVADQLIISVVRFSWINTQDQNYHEAVVNLVLRVTDHTITEMWLMIDQEIFPNTQVIEALKLSEINEKEKNIFLKRLCTKQYFHQGQWIALSETEKECLYYYLHGFAAKESAQFMGLSHRTIETYLAAIKEKLDSPTKTALRQKLFAAPIQEK